MLCTDDGRDSEFGVWLPDNRRLGSLRCRVTGIIGSGKEDDSNNPTWLDVIDDLLEFTLLDRRDDTDPRLARLADFLPAVTFGRPLLIRRFTVPLPRPVTGLLPGLLTFCGYARLCDANAGGGSLRLPFVSSLNHMRKALSRLARLRLLVGLVDGGFSPMVGKAPREPGGELAGVGGGDCLMFASNHGEPT